METNIVFRKVEETPIVKEKLEKKLAKLAKKFSFLTSVQIIIDKERYNFTVAIIIHTSKQKIFKVFVKNPNLKTALIDALNKIERVLNDYKENKKIRGGRNENS